MYMEGEARFKHGNESSGGTSVLALESKIWEGEEGVKLCA